MTKRNINDPGQVSWTFSIRMNIELAREFDQYCEERCLSRRKVLEKLVKEYLEREKCKDIE